MQMFAYIGDIALQYVMAPLSEPLGGTVSATSSSFSSSQVEAHSDTHTHITMLTRYNLYF